MSPNASTTSSNGYAPYGIQMTRLDTTSTGFTAVNGEKGSATSRPQDPLSGMSEDARTEMSKDTPTDLPPSTSERLHIWRAGSRSSYPPLDDQAADSRKRKRSDSTAASSNKAEVDGSIAASEEKALSRRSMQLDSAVDLSSPQTQGQLQPAFPGDRKPKESRPLVATSREPSPVRYSSHKDPVPPPQTAIEAELAESLQRELRKNAAPMPSVESFRSHSSAPRASAGSLTPSPQNDAPEYDVNYSNNSPDQQDGDGKKRKRNFSNRTKTGCHTCRSRKKKCDEGKPQCGNCTRSNYFCKGYGPKPLDDTSKTANGTARNAMQPLQSKPAYEPPPPGPTGYYPQQPPPPPPHNGPPHGSGLDYSHWGGRGFPPPPSRAHPPPMPLEPSAPCHHHDSHRPHPYPPTPSEYPSIPPIQPYGTPTHPQPPPMSIASWPPEPSPYPAPTYRPGTAYSVSGNGGPGTATSSASNASSQTSAARTAALHLKNGNATFLTEKQKMLLGQPFSAYMDHELRHDRNTCRAAVERYNDSSRISDGRYSIDEHARLFAGILDPTRRPGYSHHPQHAESYTGPKGHAGLSTLVECPFSCTYGYNIRLGNDVLIQPGCEFQDACEVVIGDRTIVGPNVKFRTQTAFIDPQGRTGPKSKFLGGKIVVGEDCFIGGDVVILPFRRIGRGAVVGAGSVVTKDVKEYTVVAGNPAKYIRRIEPGPNVEKHKHDIQEQNERMAREMVEDAMNSGDR